jgi:hypothetical protein
VQATPGTDRLELLEASVRANHRVSKPTLGPVGRAVRPGKTAGRNFATLIRRTPCRPLRTLKFGYGLAGTEGDGDGDLDGENAGRDDGGHAHGAGAV